MLRAAFPLGLLALATAPAEAQRLAYDLSEPAAPAKEPGEADQSSQGPRLQYALLDRFEWAPKGDSYAWDFSALLGGDRDRVYFGFSGDGAFAGGLDTLELDTFYSRNVGGDWDLNAGLRYDMRPHPTRLYAALGAQYDDDKLWVGAWTYLSNKGELSARLAAYYNLRLVNRLVLQPSLELDVYAKDAPALGTGRGFSYAEAGLRMRYEMIDHLAPYVGFSWSRDLGRTAGYDRAAGEDPETKSIVLGVRSEF
jgi:copper resistance protein B